VYMKKTSFGIDRSGNEHGLPGKISSFLLIVEGINNSAVIFPENKFSCLARVRDLPGQGAYIEMQLTLQEFRDVI
jgi:hypothetical protein